MSTFSNCASRLVSNVVRSANLAPERDISCSTRRTYGRALRCMQIRDSTILRLDKVEDQGAHGVVLLAV
eukprot:6192779-Pleurochrysis_carterae.AAC.2